MSRFDSSSSTSNTLFFKRPSRSPHHRGRLQVRCRESRYNPPRVPARPDRGVSPLREGSRPPLAPRGPVDGRALPRLRPAADLAPAGPSYPGFALWQQRLLRGPQHGGRFRGGVGRPGSRDRRVAAAPSGLRPGLRRRGRASGARAAAARARGRGRRALPGRAPGRPRALRDRAARGAPRPRALRPRHARARPGARPRAGRDPGSSGRAARAGGAGLHRGAQRRQRRHAPVLAPEGDPRSPRPPLPLRAADPGTSDREGRAEDARNAAVQSRRARVAARASGASSAGVGRARSAGASRAARRPSSFGRARILAPAAALAQAAPAGKPDPGRGGEGGVSGTRRLAAQVAGSAGVQVWLAFLGIFTTPFILRGLGAAAYGIFALVSVVSAHLSNLELGFGHATVRYLARARAAGDRPGEQAILDTSLAVFLAGGIVAGSVLFTAARFLATSFF